jgi:hypothetical protein
MRPAAASSCRTRPSQLPPSHCICAQRRATPLATHPPRPAPPNTALDVLTPRSPAPSARRYNSGLAEHAAGWLPTLRDLYWHKRVPLALTSYHAAEAQLDARTLAVRMRVPLRQFVTGATPNPFSARLPHLDELFPGRTYTANAFLTIAVPPSED